MACFGAGPSFIVLVGWVKTSLAVHDFATGGFDEQQGLQMHLKAQGEIDPEKNPFFFQKWRESVGKVA